MDCRIPNLEGSSSSSSLLAASPNSHQGDVDDSTLSSAAPTPNTTPPTSPDFKPSSHAGNGQQNPRRPRSLSFSYSSSSVSRLGRSSQFSLPLSLPTLNSENEPSELLDSLDLPPSLPLALSNVSLCLLGSVRDVEARMKRLEEGRFLYGYSSTEEDDSDVDDFRLSGNGADGGTRRPRGRLVVVSQEAGATGDGVEGESDSSSKPSSSLEHFIRQVYAYVERIKSELPPPPYLSLINERYPGKETTTTDGQDRQIIDPDLARQFLTALSLNLERMQDLLSQLSLIPHHPTDSNPPTTNQVSAADTEKHADGPSTSSQATSTNLFSPNFTSSFANMYASAQSLPDSLSLSRLSKNLSNNPHIPIPSFAIPKNLPPLPPLQALKTYYLSESEKISKKFSTLQSSFSESLAATFHNVHIPTSGEVVDAATDLAQAAVHMAEDLITESERYAAALKEGAKRLLMEHELPDGWKNNSYIRSGYRFIPIERWQELMGTLFTWHNETVNVWTHLIGCISLVYLLIFIFPFTPQGSPETSTTLDRLISRIFIFCAFSCLLCSATYHLFVGCATRPVFLCFACVDYLGISALISASVVTTTWYGFYCRRELAWWYIGVSGVVGVAGMILPFQSFFNKREYKMFRVAFFLCMAFSALAPMAHLSYLHGFGETMAFYKPILPSVTAYVVGLIFYANNFPECWCPGGLFDTLFASHQCWHVAIVLAIWAHWNAITKFHQVGTVGYSCAASGGGGHQHQHHPSPPLSLSDGSVVGQDGMSMLEGAGVDAGAGVGGFGGLTLQLGEMWDRVVVGWGS